MSISWRGSSKWSEVQGVPLDEIKWLQTSLQQVLENVGILECNFKSLKATVESQTYTIQKLQQELRSCNHRNALTDKWTPTIKASNPEDTGCSGLERSAKDDLSSDKYMYHGNTKSAVDPPSKQEDILVKLLLNNQTVLMNQANAIQKVVLNSTQWLQNLTKQMESLCSQKFEQDKKYQALEGEKNQVSKCCKEFEEEKNQIIEKCKVHKVEKNQLSEKYTKFEEEKNQIIEKCKVHKVEKNQLSEKYTKLEEEKNQLSEKCIELEVEKNQLSEKCTKLEEEKNQLCEKCIDLEVEKNQLSEKCMKLEVEKNQLSEKCLKLEEEKYQLSKRCKELEEVNKEIAKLKKDCDMLSAENNYLKNPAMHSSSRGSYWYSSHNPVLQRKPVRTLVYCPRNSDLMTNVVSELRNALQFQMSTYNLELNMQMRETPSEIRGTLPVIVICLQASRLGTDVSNALQGVQNGPNIAVLVLHHKDIHALPTQSSDRILTGSEYKNVGAIIDMAFLTGKGMYACDMNNRALETLMEFLKRYSQP